MNPEKCKKAIYSNRNEEAVDPALLKFCIDHFIQLNNIRADLVDSGWRGILATNNIVANTCILRVPRNILLSCESARRCDELLTAATARTCPPLSPLSLLAAHLLHEISKGVESFWADYLRSLPPSYTTAISLSSTEANNLQVAYAQRQVAAATRAAENLFTQGSLVLQKLNLPGKWRSKSAWIWALSTLSSRTMFLPTDPEAGCLTPFGDLFNYAPPEPPYTPDLAASEARNTTKIATLLSGDGCLNIDDDEYCIYARTDYQPGEEIFLCYGRYTNLELLEHYGFVLQGEDHVNPHDTAILPVTVLSETVLAQLQSMGGIEPSIHANGNPSWQFLRALRLAALTPAQRKIKSSAILLDQKADDESEIWVMKTLIKACQEALNGLPTTLKQDEQLLKAGEFETAGMEVVVQWRVGYKKILSKTIEICSKVLKNLLENNNDIMKARETDAVSLVNLNIRQPKLLANTRRAAAAVLVPPPPRK